MGLEMYRKWFTFTRTSFGFNLCLISALVFSMFGIPRAQGNVALETVVGFSIVEGNDGYGAPTTNLQAEDRISSSRITCKGLTDPDCTNKFLIPAAYLVPCTESATVACISEVYAVAPDAERIDATYIRSVGKNPEFDFAEMSSIRLARGEGAGGIWQFPGLIHGGSTDIYAVQARISGWMTEDRSRINYVSAQLGIAAVRQEPGNFSPFTPLELDDKGTFRGFANGDQNCVLTELQTCFRRAILPKDYRFGMKIKIPNALSGWFHGRISKPAFTITAGTDGFFFYEVTAQPVVVPGVSKLTPYSAWTPEFRNFATEQWPFSNGGGVLLPGNIGQLSMELTKRFLPMVEDRATTSSTFWVVRTLDEWGDGKFIESIDQKIKSCSTETSGLAGIVTTNAMIYAAGPPRFQEETQSLDYKVLSPHLDEKGVQNLGSYDLLLDSKVARCIYGFSSAPIKAELEIIGSDGNTKVATTVLGERDGWLFLSANGFTYSEPTIRVTLSQEAPPKVQPTPVASTPSAATINDDTSKTSSVSKKPTCIKGKKSIKPTKGKCPKGFKKSR
jgi:hypothetical protein